MFSKKIVLGIGGTMVILATTIGVAGIASADVTTPTPSPTARQTWQRGAGYGRTATAVNPNAGLRNGAGYGAVANQAYLAEGLGVSQDAVAAAMQAYHADNAPAARGRDLTVEQRAAEHADLATFLAGELKVDQAKVLELLNARQVGTGYGPGPRR